MAGFKGTDRGERSTEMRGWCRGEGESVSDLATPLLNLLTLGVASESLVFGVSYNVDLFKLNRNQIKKHKIKCQIFRHNPLDLS